MKRALLLIAVPALLVALGFAQTPATSSKTDPTIVKGCLGGSDGNYTVAEDNTGRIFKLTTSSVDLKAHLGHDVSVIGHRAGGMSSADADSGFTVTALNMISEHCAGAAAVPAATVSTLSETTIPPAGAAAAPAATTSTVAETAVTPAVAAVAPAATTGPVAETVVTAPAAVTPPAVVTPPAETVVTPPAAVAAPAETVVTPAAVTPPAETVVTPSERVSTHAARPRKVPAVPAAATAKPDVTANSSAEPVSPAAAAAATPIATPSTASEPVSTPAAVATTPAAPAGHGSLWLLISFAVLVIVLGILAPIISRWRKRKSLDRADAPNLSFNREASSDQVKSDAQPRKAA